MNVNVLGGIKIWVVIDSDLPNYTKYRELLKKELKRCPNITREKDIILQLPALVNGSKRSGIIFQELSELVATTAFGENQITDPQSSITLARNLALSVCVYYFDIYLVYYNKSAT